MRREIRWFGGRAWERIGIGMYGVGEKKGQLGVVGRSDFGGPIGILRVVLPCPGHTGTGAYKLRAYCAWSLGVEGGVVGEGKELGNLEAKHSFVFARPAFRTPMRTEKGQGQGATTTIFLLTNKCYGWGKGEGQL